MLDDRVPLHGSHAAEDVRFLLKPLTLAPITGTAEKERLIQTGQRHYSELIGREQLPSPQYFSLFEQAVESNAACMARDVMRLARHIVGVQVTDATPVDGERGFTVSR